jgi:hypothetical protein
MALTESDGKKNKSYGNDKAALKAKAERVLVADLSANDIKLINYGKKHGLNVSEIKETVGSGFNKKAPPTDAEIKGVLDGTIKKPTGIFKK